MDIYKTSHSWNMSLFSQSCEIAVVSSHLTDKVDKNMRNFPVIPEKFLNPWVHMLAQILDHCSYLSLQHLKVELMLWWFVQDRFISWDTVCNPARCASGSRMCVWGTYVAHWYDWVETLTNGATQANEKAVILYIQMCILNVYLGLKVFFIYAVKIFRFSWPSASPLYCIFFLEILPM